MLQKMLLFRRVRQRGLEENMASLSERILDCTEIVLMVELWGEIQQNTTMSTSVIHMINTVQVQRGGGGWKKDGRFQMHKKYASGAG